MKSCKELSDLSDSIAKIKDDIDVAVIKIGEMEVSGKENLSHSGIIAIVKGVFDGIRDDIKRREDILVDFYEIMRTYEEVG